jgi:hypothetical protein
MIKRSLDALYTYRFIRTLVMPWNKTEAYKLGLLDDEGTKLRKPETAEEKDAYTFFHRVVFNIKRLIGKAPMGKRLISFVVALKLLKEQTGLSEEEVIALVERATDFEFDKDLNEDSQTELDKGITYSLTTDYPTAHVDLPEGSLVQVTGKTETHFGVKLYEARHILTEELIYITENEVAPSYSVSTGDVANIPTPLRMPNGDKYQKFKVPPALFNQINSGRQRYQRWNKFLDLNDSTQNSISQFAKKHRDATVVIEDEATGATRALKPLSMSDYQT